MNDPIQEVEKVVREAHDSAGKLTRPAARRYPLLFATLLTISFVAILHGFELLADKYEILRESPVVLIAGGFLVLFITGRLYHFLQNQ